MPGAVCSFILTRSWAMQAVASSAQKLGKQGRAIQNKKYAWNVKKYVRNVSGRQLIKSIVLKTTTSARTLANAFGKMYYTVSFQFPIIVVIWPNLSAGRTPSAPRHHLMTQAHAPFDLPRRLPWATRRPEEMQSQRWCQWPPRTARLPPERRQTWNTCKPDVPRW